MKEKIIGILGGMGPEATAELFMNIIRATPVEKDQDHIRVIIDSNPKIPDRTLAIIGLGPSPLPEMVKTAENLERAGVDFIIIPCNTAHHFYDELSKSVKVPILNMIELAAEVIHGKYPKIKKVGLIATTGTINSGIYHQALKKHKLQVLCPSDRLQDKVMEAIYGVKAGRLAEGRGSIINIASQLIAEGAETVICGCTEVSLVLKQGDISMPVVDPLQILAKTAVAIALGRKEQKS